MLEFTHDWWLVAASFAVALMAGFTGMTLTKGASSQPEGKRKITVALAAVVLGGGIWWMHFVAMLGLQLPILFYYDALITLISALVAILMVGLALLLLHFRPRTAGGIVSAGAVVGLGIVAMHYIGMAGMQLCRPVYSFGDIAVSTIASLMLSILAIWVAYDARTHRNILLGTMCFAVAVVTMHFVAVGLTQFTVAEGRNGAGPLLDNQVLAIGVTLSVFLICGAFLLTGITFLEPTSTEDQESENSKDVVRDPVVEPTPEAPKAGVPFEREGQTHFAMPESIAAIGAEGHYTLLYVGDEKLFCPWSISEAAQRLEGGGFLRTHRSYLVNPSFVSSFERKKDSGTCYFDKVTSLQKVPVSRSQLKTVRNVLGV